METISFTACKFLCFDKEKYGQTCKLALLGQPAKCVWDRRIPDGPRLVQFCEKRGRLTYPESCLNPQTAHCGDYFEHTHTVNIDDIDD